MAFDLSAYNTVAERIAEFREKHPEGSLLPVDAKEWYRIEVMPDGQAFIVYAAAAYRTPDDPRPGIGVAWEPFPGTTSFTKDSELQNAETSAWGRAIVAALAADTRKGVASAEEIRNRQDADAEAPQAPPRSGNGKPTAKQKGYVRKLLGDHGGEWPVEVLEFFDGEIPHEDEWSKGQMSWVIDKMKSTPPPPKPERRGPGVTVPDSVHDRIPDDDERPF